MDFLFDTLKSVYGITEEEYFAELEYEEGYEEVMEMASAEYDRQWKEDFDHMVDEYVAQYIAEQIEKMADFEDTYFLAK